MRKRLSVWIPILALSSTLGGCGPARGPVNPAIPNPPGPAGSTTTRYTLKGVVREVDAAQGIVTIAHDDIPGFMKAMTMDFTPADRSNLGEIREGDRVEGPLEVKSADGAVEAYDLLKVEVTEKAPMTLRLGAGTGTATLAPKPEVLRPGQAVPDFAMTTQDGGPLRLSDLRGKVVVLTFIYTRCPLPDYCPAVDRKFQELAGRIGAVRGRADAVRLLSVSFDPEHDTPEALRRHADLRGARPPLWTYAVASHDELRKVVERLGLIYGPSPAEIRHNLCTAVIAPDGALARLDVGAAGKAWTPADLMPTIIGLMPASEKNKSVSP